MPEPFMWIAAFLLGSLLGHGIRRATPALLGMKDRSLPFRLPWPEAVAGIGWVVLLWAPVPAWGPQSWPPFAGRWLLWGGFFLLLLAICATDYLTKLIPDRLTIAGSLFGIGLHWLDPRAVLDVSWWHPLLLDWAGRSPDDPWLGLWLAGAGAGLGFLVLEGLRRAFSLLVGMEVMGMGDSKLLMLIGAFLGPAGALGALALSFPVGIVHGLVHLKMSGQAHSPFGPPLAAAAMLVLTCSQMLLGALGWLRTLVLQLSIVQLAAFYTVAIGVVVVLLWRTRARAAEYEAAIEEDYRRIEERLDEP